tara:strand:+ start:90 stop:911 length:822 start_codon:yes stop_codon:yes gene_type:complete
MKKLILLLLIVPMVSFGQMDYYVSAKGGLNVREAPNARAKKLVTLLYGQKITIESKTGVKLTINDIDKKTGITKAIEGEWVEISSGEKIKGYVFDGFLKGVLSGTDFYTLTIQGKSKIYDYDSYQIITTYNSDLTGYEDAMGEEIKIVSKVDESIEFVIEGENDFVGLVNSFMITQDGGMNDPGDNFFYIYDLQKQENIFASSCYGYKIVNSKIEFSEVVQESRSGFVKPKCSEEFEKTYGMYPGNGYVEKFIYDITNQQLERTGIFECAYFQ